MSRNRNDDQGPTSRRRPRGRRWLGLGLPLLVVLTLVVVAGVVALHVWRERDATSFFGQTELSLSGLRNVESFQVAGATVVYGDGRAAQVTATRVASREDNLEPPVRSDGPLSGWAEDGGLWTVDQAPAGGNVLVEYDRDLLRLGSLSVDHRWAVPRTGGADEDLKLLAVDRQTAVVQVGCGPDERRCEVVGVRDGRTRWRRAASGDIGVVETVGGAITYASHYSVALPTRGLLVRGRRLVQVDARGGLHPTRISYGSDDDADRPALTAVGDDVSAISVEGGRCAATGATGRARHWSARFRCTSSEPTWVRGTRAYFASGASATGSRIARLDALDLRTGEVTAVGRTTGLPGVGASVLVDGQGGHYRARSTDTGKVLWRRRIDHSAADDAPGLGTGMASVSRDTAVVRTVATGWPQRWFGGQRDRISLLDLRTGHVLRTALAPGDSQVTDVVALDGHRALVFLGDREVRLLTVTGR